MLTATTGFDTTLNGKVMTVGARLELDLPASLAGDFTAVLKSITLDTQSQTDLPDGIRDEVGFSNIGGSIVLAGTSPTGMSIADLLKPDNSSSPLYRLKVKGTPVRFSYGVRPQGAAATELLRKLTGRVASYSINQQDEVTLTVVDLSQDWNDLTNIPSVITAPPYNAGLTNEFVLDQIVRTANGASSWPARRPQCVFAAGFRSSLTPELGDIDTTFAQPVFSFAPGVNGTGLSSPVAVGSGQYAVATFNTSGPVGTAVFIEFDATTNANDNFLLLSDPAQLPTDFVRVSARNTSVRIDVGDGGWTVPATNPSHIEVTLSLPAVGSSTYSGSVSVDGTITALPAQSFARNRAVAGWTRVQVSPGSGATISGLQITTETAPVTDYPFTPAAVIDPSLNPLTVVPPIDADAKAWDVIQQIAASECGYARRDEFGVFRFSNRNAITTQTVARTITADTSLKDSMVTDVGGGTEARRVRVPYTAWTFGTPTVVWTAASILVVRRKSTFTFTQQITDLAAAIDPTSVVLPNGHTPSDGNTWHRASTSSAGLAEHPGITVTITQATANSVTVTLANTSGQDAYLVTPANYTDFAVGTPALWIGGTPASPADEAAVDVTFDTGDMPFTVSSNPYNQDANAAHDLGTYLLTQLATPIRDFTNLAIVPDSRIQIGDLLHLQDPTRSFVDEYVTVWGWSFNATFPSAGQAGGTWDMQLNVRAIAAPGGWIGEIPGRSEGDLTTYGY